MTEPVLVARDLTCGYPPDEPVLEHASIEVARGEVVMIIGGSGSGKSTFMRALSGLQAALAGEVWLFGERLDVLDRDRRAKLLRRTGMVFQRDALLGSLSLRENVMLPILELTTLPLSVATALAQAKLELMEIGQLAHRLPAEISGGQRKRAALARALVLDPELLFCDEPTSGLDPITAAKIDRLLLHLRDLFGLSILAVTHDIESVLADADRALVVGDGRIVGAGTAAELMANDDPEVRPFFHRVEQVLEGQGGVT